MNRLILVLIIIIMTLIGSFGGFFFKKSTSGDGILSIVKNKFLYIGGALYVICALMNIYVLKYMPLSVVLPMTAITYVWSMISSRLILKENITKYKILGICFIILGVFFIGIS